MGVNPQQNMEVSQVIGKETTQRWYKSKYILFPKASDLLQEIKIQNHQGHLGWYGKCQLTPPLTYEQLWGLFLLMHI